MTTRDDFTTTTDAICRALEGSSKKQLFWVCAGCRWGVFYWRENSGLCAV